MNELLSFKDVRAFHEAFEHPILPFPQVPGVNRKTLRARLVTEEYHEFIDALQRNDLVELADAIADLIYVLQGTALEYGIDMNPVWAEVHRSNMAKLGPDGKPIKDAGGKLLKPEGWTPPDIAAIIAEQIRAGQKTNADG